MLFRSVPGQVDRQRRKPEAEDDGVPGVGVLAAAVQEDDVRLCGTPLQRTDRTGVDPLDGRKRARGADLFGVLAQQREFVEARQFVVGDFRHGSTLRTTEIQVLFERRCVSVNCMSAMAYAPTGLTIRTAGDADWSAMGLVAATCFGDRRPQETTDMWRTMMPEGSAVVACDGADVVGMAAYVDLELTVPGGAVLPMAGVTWVAVSPTHRRRGVLRAMCW